MVSFTPGTGGAVTAATLENQFYTIIVQVHSKQLDTSINTKGADLVDSSLVEDTLELTGTLKLYTNTSYSSGTTLIELPDPFVGAGWVEGTSGDGNATNYNHALYDRALMLIYAERASSSVSTLRFTNPNWSVENSTIASPATYNGRFNCSFRLQLEVVPGTDGAQYKASEYIL